jgi:hypothetical protein
MIWNREKHDRGKRMHMFEGSDIRRRGTMNTKRFVLAATHGPAEE